jgi:uncharacterized damage-inducible protein DinB
MERRFGAPIAGEEKDVLAGFLDHYRRTMLDICEGLTDEQLKRPMVPSGTSLLGMVKHLAWVERGWFTETIAGEEVEYPFDFDADPDADLRAEADETKEEIFDLYRQACDESRSVLAAVSLDDPVKGTKRSRDYNVRWVVTHMIEETARHAGHADILREMIDGRTETGYV